MSDRHEAELIKEVVEMVLLEGKKTPLVTGDYLVGIGYHVKEMLKLLDVSSTREVRIVGIHGMGGIGKTTIAKAIYNEISCHFESCSFIEDVRETTQQHKGRVEVQKQLISNILGRKNVAITSVDEGVNMIKERCCNKKVLIVLDDIDNLNQLRALANKHDWFGLGSRIIITTRDKHILEKHAVDEVYEPVELDYYQSLQLFSLHAFGRDRPPNDYYNLSSAIAKTTGGLPLALEVIGGHLLDKKPKAVWEDTLEKLKKIPDDEVQTKLRISYDALEYEQKQIFLDIACFFIGMNKRIVSYFWKEYFPHHGIDNLLRWSLVKIGDHNELRMHSQLRDLGREIVRSENFNEPGERSRLWFHDDAWEVLKTHTGTQKVQGLCLDFGNGSEQNCLRNEEFDEMSKLGNGSEENFLRKEEFAGMSRLRLLQIDYVIVAGDFTRFLSRLEWLSWKGCPYNVIATNFHLENLIVLDLSWSKVTEDWDGWNQIKTAKKLKFINLSSCYDLIKTPDFSAFPYLEELILEDCKSLVEIDTSIGYLKRLVFLNVKNCQSLVDLPISICGLNSLESLIVSGCIKLGRLPTGLESLKALRELRIDETSIEQLPDHKKLPKKLEILSARNCQFLTVVPTSIGQVRFLTDVALDETQIVMLPDSIGSLSNLRHLSLCHCISLRKIPDSIGQLESLVNLNLYNTGVTKIPDSIGQLTSLKNFCLDRTKIIELPDSVGLLVKLEKLSLRYCTSLRKIPYSFGQLESLVRLDLSRTFSLRRRNWTRHCERIEEEIQLTRTEIVVLPDSIGSLFKLRKLSLGTCISVRKIPDSIGQLESLVELRLSGAGVTKIPDSIGSLSMLQELSLGECPSLRRIPDSIGKLESLRKLDLRGIIEIPDAIGELKSLTHLELDSTQIIELPDSIGSLSMLQDLSLRKCESLRRIPDSIGRLKSLRRLDLTECGIIEIPDTIGGLKSLNNLVLDGTQIIKLPDSIGSLSKLTTLSLRRCGSLRRIPDSTGRLETLHSLDLSGSGIIEIPDAIGELRSLRRLDLEGTQIIELPDSIRSLPELEHLSLMHCRLFTDIPNAVGNDGNPNDLRTDMSGIDGWDCFRAGGEIPIDIGKLLSHSLRYLKLGSENSFILPDSIGSIPRLEFLDITNCINHPSLPHLPSTLSELHISRCTMESLHNFYYLTNLRYLTIADCENLLVIPSFKELKILSISNCKKLECFPHLPSVLEHLSLSSSMSIESIPDLSNVERLSELELIDFFKQTKIQGLERMKSLRKLNLSGCRSIKRLPNMSIMKRLETLILRDCEKLCDIEGLERLKYLYRLDVSGCISVESVPDLSNLKRLFELKLIERLERMKCLRSLNLSGWSIERLPNMSITEELHILILRNCEKLCDIESLKRLECLYILDVSGCISLERLPNLSNLKNLKKLWISNCKQLMKIQGIKKGLHIYGRTTGSRYVKIKSATGVEHLKDEKFTGETHWSNKRLGSLETHRSIKRLRSLFTKKEKKD